MISYPLLKQTVRENYKLLLVIAAVLSIYTIMIIGMYDPDITEKMEDLLSALPAGMLSAFGFSMEEQTLTGFLASYLFGFLMLVFPMLYEIPTAYRMIASKIEQGSMAYLIGTPNSRKKIAFTLAFYLSVSTAVLMLYVAALGTVVSSRVFPGMLRTGIFLDLCTGAFALHFLIGGISFFAACVGKDMGQVLGIGAGIPVVSYLIHMLANMEGNLTFLKYVTIFSLFDTKRILEADRIGYLFMGILAAAGMLFYVLGIVLFRKRDLSV